MYRRAMLALCAAALSIVTLAASDGQNGGAQSSDQLRLRTRLSGPAIKGEKPSGNADFRIDDQGRRRLNVEVEDVNLPDGTMLSVSVVRDGSSMKVGSLTLFGGGDELELRTQNGDHVPQIQKGDFVVVVHSGTVILAGVF